METGGMACMLYHEPLDEAARHYPNDAAAIDDTYRVPKRVVAKPDEPKAIPYQSGIA